MSQSNNRTPYAADEDVALRAGPDFRLLCPVDQVVVAAADGVFAAADPWMLTSASTNFVTRGVAAGQVVQLLKPVAAFAAPGAALAVQAVGPTSLTLRRKGQATAMGHPPGGGGLTGVEFLIVTLAPQLARASAEIDRRLGLDPALPSRTPKEVQDLEALRDATVLLVLAQAYEALDRAAGGDEVANSRAEAIRRELDDAMLRLSSRWAGAGPGNRLRTRLSR